MAIIWALICIFGLFGLMIYGVILRATATVEDRREREYEAERNKRLTTNISKIEAEIKNESESMRGCVLMRTGYMLAVDDGRRIVTIAFADTGRVLKFPFSHIVGCETKKEVITQSHSSGLYNQTGNFITGGSNTSYTRIIKTYESVIRLCNESVPAVRFEYVNRPVGYGKKAIDIIRDKDVYEDSELYEEYKNFAEKVDDHIKSVVAANRYSR